jgi:hypothetical protein
MYSYEGGIYVSKTGGILMSAIGSDLMGESFKEMPLFRSV